jgi:hypothetical protein
VQDVLASGRRLKIEVNIIVGQSATLECVALNPLLAIAQ